MIFIAAKATIQALINSLPDDQNNDQSSLKVFKTLDFIHSNPTCTVLWCFLYNTHSLCPPPSTQKSLMVSHCITKSQLYQNLLCMILAPNSFLRAICHYMFSNTSTYILFTFICSINLKHPFSFTSTSICVPLLKPTYVLIHLSKRSTHLTDL